MWIYQNEPFLDPENWYGFIYEITNNETGRKYIGRSSKELLSDIDKYGKEKFSRKILMLCQSRGNTNYWEAKFLFDNNVLLDDNYYNEWIMVKTHRKHLKK